MAACNLSFSWFPVANASQMARTSGVQAFVVFGAGSRRLDRRRWRTRLELANAIFEYLEIFHNRQRRHSAIGWLTPVEFEKRLPSTVA
jgi:transposase InsO family protein